MMNVDMMVHVVFEEILGYAIILMIGEKIR
jgi:hypothetical protein